MKHYKRALVLGLGTSGVAAARCLVRERTSVTAVDRANTPLLRRRAAALRKLGVRVILGATALPKATGVDNRKRATGFDICIVSPGIRSDSQWIKDIETKGVQVISEIELGASRCKRPILAVTGSKGKSTLVKLIVEAMSVAGFRAAPAGNYGVPLCDVVAKSSRLDWIVVEVSSFQLENVKHFRPRVGVLLNLQPDHLDRHMSMLTYARLKARIFAKMSGPDVGVVPFDISKRVIGMAGGRNRWVTFGLSRRTDYRYKDGKVYFKDNGRLSALSFEGTMFANDILGSAAAAAIAAVRACGIEANAVEKAARTFKPLPHRMSEVASINDVRFVNDSKATSLTALSAGVKMCGTPVRLIAGGLLKEKNLALAQKVLERAVKRVYLIGQASGEMAKTWKHFVPCRFCVDLKTAVFAAFKDSKPGETVLLSPGCASFDQFDNFEDRGNQFIKIVRLLDEEK
jgi:UDP-N-acetylmuramoylalanine--D-glutamate ligase